MKWTITDTDAFPLIEIQLEKGESIKADFGSMVAMSQHIALTGKMDGGIIKAMARRFSGEFFFLQNIEAEGGSGWVHLASPAPGQITTIEIKEGQEYSVQKNGFLAGTPGVQVSTKVQSLGRALLGGEGMFIVKLSGSGTAFLSTYGSMHHLDIPAGETVLVDNGHLVAWDSSLQYEVTKAASSWTSALTSGAGIGCRFTGPGRVIVQTRNPYALGAWLMPYLPIPQMPTRGN